MVKRFRFRISRVIPSFHSCRSKDPSNLPENPLPAFFILSPLNSKAIDIDFPAPPTLPKTRNSSLIRRHVSSAVHSVGCGCRSKSVVQSVITDGSTESPEFRWKKEEKWHVVARVKDQTHRRKIYDSSVSGESEENVSPSTLPQMATEKKEKKQRNKKKKSKRRVRFSTSSADSCWFSSEGGDENDDEDEETETLVSSSRTFSTDSSSDFGTNVATISETTIKDSRRTKKNPKRVRKVKRFSSTRKTATTHPSPETESPARLSVFQRLMPCKVEGKVKESFAVVKKSEDPLEDFKRSMLEMILEKQMFDARELEQLLHCFLFLNSRRHHAAIVEAFSEIWEVLFCKSPLNRLVL